MNSQVSNTLVVTISPVVLAPVIKGVLAGNPPGSLINLSWTCATGGVTAFTLYKNANGNGFALYKTFAGTTLAFTDTILDDPTDDIASAAYYIVAAVNAALSGPSNEVTNS